MSNSFRNVLAVIVGIVAGSIINMGIIMIGTSIIPAPHGIDITTEEGLIEAMPLFKPINFLMPFLAHAIGTWAGAFIATKISKNKKFVCAMIVGAAFFVGGAIEVLQLPSPLWFSVTDLAGAYFPMAIIGMLMAGSRKKMNDDD